MAWKVRSSNRMLILGTILIIIGFILIALFPTFLSFSPSSRLAGWFWAILIMLSFELGIFSILVIRTKGIVKALALSLIWSLVVLIPVPSGYEEPVYGGSLILLVALAIFYDKRKNLQKNLPKEP